MRSQMRTMEVTPARPVTVIPQTRTRLSPTQTVSHAHWEWTWYSPGSPERADSFASSFSLMRWIPCRHPSELSRRWEYLLMIESELDTGAISGNYCSDSIAGLPSRGLFKSLHYIDFFLYCLSVLLLSLSLWTDHNTLNLFCAGDRSIYTGLRHLVPSRVWLYERLAHDESHQLLCRSWIHVEFRWVWVWQPMAGSSILDNTVSRNAISSSCSDTLAIAALAAAYWAEVSRLGAFVAYCILSRTISLVMNRWPSHTKNLCAPESCVCECVCVSVCVWVWPAISLVRSSRQTCLCVCVWVRPAISLVRSSYL